LEPGAEDDGHEKGPGDEDEGEGAPDAGALGVAGAVCGAGETDEELPLDDYGAEGDEDIRKIASEEFVQGFIPF
jgi:hypothetical protein